MPCALKAETGGRGRSLENKIFPGENCCCCNIKLCDLALNPPCLGGKVIEVANFVLSKQNFNQIYRISQTSDSHSLCKISAPNFENFTKILRGK